MSPSASKWLAAVAACGLLACGGSDGGPTEEFDKTVSEATMLEVAGYMYGFAKEMRGDMSQVDTWIEPFGLTKGDVGVSGQNANSMVWERLSRHRLPADGGVILTPDMVNAACAANVVGGQVDTDADGIPDDMTVTYPADCTLDDVPGYLVTWAGSYRMRDQAGLIGYRLDLDDVSQTVVNTTTGKLYRFTYNGTERTIYTPTKVTRTMDETLERFDSVAGSPAGTTITDVYILTALFDPSPATIAVGSPLPSGQMSFDLDFRRTTPHLGTSVRFLVTATTPLAYTTACGNYNAGQLRGALNGNDDISFVVDIIGCNDTDYSLNGFTP